MKRRLSLSVTEFHQIVDAMCTQASTELSATRQRMDALRSETRPPG